MAYFFIKARNIHHTLHMGLQSVRHHVNVIEMKNNRPFYVTQSPNNSLSDVIRMHSHISKSSNYKCILSDKIVHLIVVRLSWSDRHIYFQWVQDFHFLEISSA